MSGDAWLRLLGALLFVGGLVALWMLFGPDHPPLCEVPVYESTPTEIPC